MKFTKEIRNLLSYTVTLLSRIAREEYQEMAIAITETLENYSEPVNKLYEVFSTDPDHISRQFSTLDNAVGCLRYLTDYYNYDVEIREFTTNEIDEYIFTKLLARYSSDLGESYVLDAETEKVFKKYRIEYVTRIEIKNDPSN